MQACSSLFKTLCPNVILSPEFFTLEGPGGVYTICYTTSLSGIGNDNLESSTSTFLQLTYNVATK